MIFTTLIADRRHLEDGPESDSALLQRLFGV